MSKIKVITDSASDVPSELAEMYNVTVLPLGIVINDEVYYDGVDLSNQEFFDTMKKLDKIPTTTMVPLHLVENEFRKNIDEGIYDHQIYVTLSAKASGSFNAANLIKKQMEESMGRNLNITIIDSNSFSMVYGKIVLRIAKMAQDGASLDQILLEYTNEQKTSVAYFLVDDLNHLQKGGRINPGIALIGGMLGIKPILTINDGLVDFIGKERGKRRTMEKIIGMMIDDIEIPADTSLWVANADADEDVKDVINLINDRIKLKEINEFKMGACIGTHTGSGLVGLIFNKK